MEKPPKSKNIVKDDPVAAGKLGGEKSKGGGRPKIYKTEEERRAARVRSQQKYRKRRPP